MKTKNKKLEPIFVNNYKWLRKLNYIKFLRDIGKHFTINKMLSFDSVKLRLDREQSLSYMEFNYMILQAYDFLELNRKKDCILQIGGSDQWGNIVNGVELIKRYSGKQAFGLTTKLITLSSGSKMGKTEKGAIWLNKSLLSPYEYWQFWRNTEDQDVLRFIKMFTDLGLDKIESIKNENINKLKVILASEATKLLHGEKEANKAELTAKEIFQEKKISNKLPNYYIEKNNLSSGIGIVNILVETNLVNSKGEARRVILNKGIKINDSTVEKTDYLIKRENFQNNLCKLSFGKKKHIVLTIK